MSEDCELTKSECGAELVTESECGAEHVTEAECGAELVTESEYGAELVTESECGAELVTEVAHVSAQDTHTDRKCDFTGHKPVESWSRSFVCHHKCLVEAVTSDMSFTSRRQTSSLTDKQPPHVYDTHMCRDDRPAAAHTCADGGHCKPVTCFSSVNGKCDGSATACDEAKHKVNKSLPESLPFRKVVVMSVKETGRRKRKANTEQNNCTWMQQIRYCEMNCGKLRRTDMVDDSSENCCRMHEDVNDERNKTELPDAAVDNTDNKRQRDAGLYDSLSGKQNIVEVTLLTDDQKEVSAHECTVSDIGREPVLSESGSVPVLSGDSCQVAVTCASDDVIVDSDDLESDCDSDLSIVSGPSDPHTIQPATSRLLSRQEKDTTKVLITFSTSTLPKQPV